MKYGTEKYYANLFADIIADVQHDQPETSDSLISGFKLAIKEWRDYHVKQTLELDRIANKLDEQS